MKLEELENKRIAILGFGIEGQSIADLLVSSSITVFDENKSLDFSLKEKYEQKGISFELGPIEDLSGFDIIFRSPGFHPDLPVLQNARELGSEITSATKLFFDLCPCPIIGVTGTKGKGTTSTLIYEILKEEGLDAYLGGNIGVSPLSFLEKLNSDSKVVLELSSFQLADLHKSPHVAVMLMTTSEHLDYHNDVYEYIEAKRNILKFQTSSDFAIFNRDYPASNESDVHTEAKIYKVSREQNVDQGCYVKEDQIILKMDGNEKAILPIKEVGLPGKHNLENICAAIAASLCAGATMKSILPVVKSFKGLPHRIEFIKIVRGVAYYDDSFSTAPETAIAAIESFDAPKILIIGGSSKNSDFDELGRVISESTSIKAIIGIGEEWERIKSKIPSQNIKVYEGCKNMAEIVEKAGEIGEIGDIVLLSPACASFDMFENYKERGNLFRNEVNKLS